MRVDIGLLMAVIGCFVGLGGWLAGRDRKIGDDREWRGSVNAKLDAIIGIRDDVDRLEGQVREHGEKLAEHSRDIKTAFIRIDELRDEKEDKR